MNLQRIGALLPLALAAPLSAQAAPDDAAIDDVFAEWDRPDAPGASVAVVLGGEVVFADGYGCAQLEYSIPIEAETVFHVASVSKQFTAMSVALLAVDDALSLDDEVRDHVEEMPDFGSPITIRHLLHHTSGLRDQWETLALAGWRLDDVITTRHVLDLVRRQRELNFPPGERQLYSNTGYTLLGVVAERASGRRFPELTHERIFAPLGMENTHFHDDHEHVVPNRAYSYYRADDGYKKSVLSYANAGATSLFTTAVDLARWLDNFDHARVGGAEAIELMQERAVLADGRELGYALGISHGLHRGWRTLGHSGGDAGFRSYVVWFPERRLGVAVLSNVASFDPQGRAMDVAGLFLDADGPNERKDASPRDKKERAEEIELDREVLEGFEGGYAMEDGYPLHIKRVGSNLTAESGERFRKRFYTESPTAFATRLGDARLVFNGDSGLELHREGETYRFARVEDATSVDLEVYAGLYHSPELSTLYTLAVEEGALVARHFRHGRTELKPSWPDRFRSGWWFFRSLRFERDDAGRVTGFRVSSGRTLNVLFERL